MKPKSFLLALILIASLATWARADGKFWGDVVFHDCSCDMEVHKVCVKWAAPSEDCTNFPILRCRGVPKYETWSFPPGTYYVYVVILNGSDCDHVFISGVQHGTTDQWLNLNVYGPSGEPTGPPPGP
jgi:hypothetical protein